MTGHAKRLILFGLVGFAVLLVLSEATARLLGFGHPLLYKATSAGYELVPSQSSRRFFKVENINALGMRGAETSPRPAPGVYRIISLGDSISNGGAMINDDETFQALLASNFRAAGRNVEVLNASAGGWALGNEAAWVREHGIFGAKMTLLEINDADIDQPFVPSRLLDVSPSMLSRYPPTALSEITWHYVLPKLGLTHPSADPGSPGGEAIAGQGMSPEQAILFLRERARSDQAKFAVMFWDAKIRPDKNRSRQIEAFVSSLHQAGIPIYRPQLWKRPGGAELYRDKFHPNAAANQVVARELMPFLSSIM